MSSEHSPVEQHQSSICLLWLLICKTARFQFANTLTSVIIIVGPIVVFLVYAATALFREPQGETSVKYPPVNITTKVPYIFYSPKNLVLAGVIEDVVHDLKATGSEAFSSAAELNSALTEKDTYGCVGIEFDDSLSDIKVLPNNVTVGLRFPLHLRKNPKMVWDNSTVFKHSKMDVDYYQVEGFLVVQAKLSEALIRAKNEAALLPEVVVQHYPDILEVDGLDNRVALGGVVFLPFTISAAYLAQMIVMERRDHIRDMLHLMGVRAWIYWLSWFLVAFLLLSIPTAFIVLLLQWRFFSQSDFTLVLFFLLVYNFEVLTSAFMISSFFSDTVGVQVAIVIVHLIGCLPWRLLLMDYNPTIPRAIFVCLFLNSSLAMGLQQFIKSENLRLGMHWKYMFARTDWNEFVHLGPILIFMLFGCLLRLLVLVYMEQLKSYRNRKWYFPVQSSFWCQRNGRSRPSGRDVERQETGIRGHPLIVRVSNIEKVFNGRFAVKELSLNFYQDEITVFLGHNDSGKSTIFMLLAGFLQPSAGEITINGYDLTTEQRKARRSMCFCPQHDVLFEKVEARWHLQFYCRLKGLNRKEASAEADKYLAIGRLQDFASTKVKDLPSGIKRMLLLCCNLCGNSKILLLDEPGIGMDPPMRRNMWDLLRRERKGRCIIMATHNMQEAEVVADEIVILCDAQVIGYGTTGFLTQVADTGSSYLLICTKMDTCWVAEVTHFLQTRFPDIRLQNEFGIYVTYELPTKHVQQYSGLFLELEEALNELNLLEISVCAPTLGSVFLRMGEEMRQSWNRISSIDLQPSPSPMASLLNLLPTFDVREDDGRVKCCNQWRAIMEKKGLFMRRHRKLYCLIIATPLIICLLLISFAIFIFLVDHHLSELLVTNVSIYPKAVFVIEFPADGDRFARRYIENVIRHGGSVLNTRGTPLDDYLLAEMKSDLVKVQHSFLAGVTCGSNGNSIVAWSNNKLKHGSPLSLGMVYAAIGLELAQLDIRIVNKPYEDTVQQAVSGLIYESSIEFAVLVFHYLVLATAIFAVLPILERKTYVQHQQFCSGMSRITYWLSHLFWDFCLFLVMIGPVIVIGGIALGAVLPVAMLLLAFGFSAISFTYLMCLMSNDLGKMFSIILYINMIGILAFFIHPKSPQTRYAVIEFVLSVHPHYALCCGAAEAIRTTGYYSWKQFFYMLFSGAAYLILVVFAWLPRLISYIFKYIKNEKIYPDYEVEDKEVAQIRRRLAYLTTTQYAYFPLILKNLSKRFGSFVAVRSLTLDLNPFECVGLLGRNGAGKSSTFRMIVGMESITVGSIHIKGYSLKTRPTSALRHMGFCPRESMLSEFMTGKDALRFCCLINGIRKEYIKSLVTSLAECFELVPHMNMRISTYSNGTKRKLMIAMATLAPSLMCLDEPTAGVDLHAKYEIWRILDAIRQGGRSILLTTHNLEECEFLCTNAGIMENGSLLCYGSLSRLKHRFNMGIFVKVKMGTKAEMDDERDTWKRITMMPPKDSEKGSQIGALRLLLTHLRHYKSPVEAGRKSKRISPPPGPTNSELNMRKDYEALLQRLEEVFKKDHPYSTVSDKYSYRGMITFCIPKGQIKWSAIFNYMENLKEQMQILYYSVSHTTFQDVFMEFVRKQNQESNESLHESHT
ncbi:phospholipid-transporting ATPase ABCA1 [Drosophila teissieri]|uniref:phospholipid-transporting ATPase ABCA1 n=1 Tax=Drosophila teissieri TaxID=7243 RepID=UPI001CBA3B3C|nr:phospholipid-transporting ATPase ABCA1 [Drosophila teissieri]